MEDTCDVQVVYAGKFLTKETETSVKPYVIVIHTQVKLNVTLLYYN
jgi:hypothetical protein